jgi:hypothetical protein
MNARDMLMAMLADLIRTTIDDATRFRFPSGEVGQLRGWDGDLETTDARSYVPAGKSKWEFGTGPGAAKATADYEKRTGQTPEAEMAENTLVLVNLGSWDTSKKKIPEWENDRRQEGKWKDVKYLDGVQLVHWLKDHPAIAARYARNVLRTAPQEGALSTDEYWEEFSTQFKPALNEKLVIAGRQNEADELIAKFCGPADSFMLGAETSEDPPRQNSCRLHRSTPGAAMKDKLGSIRTDIQRQSGSAVAAAGERSDRRGCAGDWDRCRHLGALARAGAVQARPRAGLDRGRPA